MRCVIGRAALGVGLGFQHQEVTLEAQGEDGTVDERVLVQKQRGEPRMEP